MIQKPEELLKMADQLDKHCACACGDGPSKVLRTLAALMKDSGEQDMKESNLSKKYREDQTQVYAWLLIEWLQDVNRKRAVFAFTEGPLRVLACTIELAIQSGPAGWRLVPLEPSTVMLAEGARKVVSQRNGTIGDEVLRIYRAMISAAPIRPDWSHE